MVFAGLHALHWLHCAYSWNRVCLWGEEAWLTAEERLPSHACGQGRLREMEGVKSSVWGICQRSALDCADNRDERGGRAAGVEGGRDYRGLDALTTGGMAAHHTHIPIAVIVSSTQAHMHADPSRSHMQIPVLIRLPPSPGGSVRSFVSRITTERIRGWLFNPFRLFKCLQLRENSGED